ncbi:MAG TPA: lysophospholipid acyltransferase family protein [Caulobacteraceae bacterium]|nr:lysophospholipid acyltransferase family protein [Caulobacteraceae bacterium]
MADKRPGLLKDIGWRLEALAFDVVSAFLRLWPTDLVSAFGGFLVGTIGPLTSEQRTVDRNLRLAFPDMPPDKRLEIARAAWRNIGRTFAELPLMHRLSEGNGRIVVAGREHLEEAIARRIPTIFFSGHISNYEVMALVVVQAGIQGFLAYRPTNNPYFDRRIVESRRRYGVKLFAAKGRGFAREVLNTLARGDSLGIMVDQKFSFGVQVPFFGHAAPTDPAPIRLALTANARIQPMSVERLKGARYRMTFYEPYYLDRTGDRDADVFAGTARITKFMEDRARENPEEYFWMHRRWADSVYRELAEKEAAEAHQGSATPR